MTRRWWLVAPLLMAGSARAQRPEPPITVELRSQDSTRAARLTIRGVMPPHTLSARTAARRAGAFLATTPVRLVLYPGSVNASVEADADSPGFQMLVARPRERARLEGWGRSLSLRRGDGPDTLQLRGLDSTRLVRTTP